jgi:hypothetical protein
MASSNTRILTKNDRISYTYSNLEKIVLTTDLTSVSTFYIGKAKTIQTNSQGLITSINPGNAPFLADMTRMMVGIGGIINPQYNLDVSGTMRVPYLQTSSFFINNTSLPDYISQVIAAGGGIGGSGQPGDLEVTGSARAISFSSIFLHASTIYATKGYIDSISASNIQAVSQQLSNLQIPQPTSQEWLAFGNTANADSVLLRSSDSVSWYTSKSPFQGGQFNSLAFNGSYWLGVGTDQNNVYTSAKSYDGLSWAHYPGPFTTGLATTLAWNGSLWVSMGLDSNSANTLATSVDGASWSVFPGPFAGGRGFAVTWNGSYWLASGATPSNANTVALSVDGISWTGYPGAGFTNQAGYGALAWNGSRWVLTGSGQNFSNSVAYSTDGITWMKVLGPFSGGYGTSIVWNGSLFLATGADGTGLTTIGTSVDGSNWTSYPGPFVGGYGLSVRWNGTTFLAAGYNPYSGSVIASSVDGIHWTDLGSIFSGTQILFATAVGYARYPEQYSLSVNSKAYISSLVVSGFISTTTINVSSFTGFLNDAQCIVVVDV